jgi:hypothetical protein
MKLTKSYFNIDDEYPSSIMEITDRQLVKTDCQRSLSRGCKNSLLPLESPSHRNYGKIKHNFLTVPKQCQIAGEEYSERAFSVLQYQLKQEDKQIHLNNLKRNLERRIQAAKDRGNNPLVALLDKEFREIVSL